MSWQLASFGLLGLALAAGFAWYERSRPSSRTVALVAALAALATLGRLAFAPLPNVKPMTDIVLISGYVLGGAPGFTVGAVSAIASNVVLSEGPWTPWQMLAWALVGVAGAILGRVARPIPRLPMALICGLAGFGYGFVLDLYTWLGYSSHSFAQYLVVEGSAFPFNLAHAIGNVVFFLAFGPALVRALRRFRARMSPTWGEATAPAATSLLVLLVVVGIGVGLGRPVAVGAAGVRNAGAAQSAATAYLVRVQNRDGGFGLGPGEASSQEATAWAVVGLAAARGPAATLARAAGWMRGHLGDLQGPGDVERTVLALALARAPLGPLVARLEGSVRGDGSVAGQANLTSFAILALRAAGLPAARLGAERAWLVRQQGRDGGFSFGAAGDPEDVDDTAAALEALVAASAPGVNAERARRYLLAHENADGGFPLEPGAGSNAQSTAWALQALIASGAAAGGSARAQAYLRARMTASGAVQYAAGVMQTPVWVTGEALAALAGATLP
jgi:Prenyltransferase and squalene oxidase repeat